jgi:uroporphyrinogen-III synthase
LEAEALAKGDTRTLAGRRIIVTRAPEQADEIVGSLQALGAEVLLLPMVRFTAPSDTSDLDRAIASLDSFDWLLFTSANAVRFFLARCRMLGRWPSSGLRVAVVGPATRDALEDEGLRAAIAPRDFLGSSLAAELGAEAAGLQVLLPRSDQAGEELPRLLRAAGAIVTPVVAYATAPPESLDSGALEALRRGDADAITFFSPSAFRYFAKSFGTDAVRRLSARVALAAVGPVTAAAIRDAGLPVSVEAAQSTAAGLVTALERYFQSPFRGYGSEKSYDGGAVRSLEKGGR